MHHLDFKSSLYFCVFQKKRCKTKAGDRVETLRPSVPLVTAVNGGPRCNDESSLHFLPSTCNGYTSTCSSRDCVSEGSSESSVSTLSEESFGSAPSMNGHEPILCNGDPPLTLPPAKSKIDKRSLKRRRSKNAEMLPEGQCVGEMLHAPLPVTVMPTLGEIIKGKADLGVATFGRTAVTGRV